MEHLVKECQESAVQGMNMFLRNFSHVPEEKLTWTPAPTAKSAMRIAAHTALYAGRFAQMIEAKELPGGDDLESWLAARNAEETALTSRVEMEGVFRQGTDRVVAALASLTPEEIGASLDSRLGWSMPMTQLMRLPGWHATLHTGQIDFLQTCWGDQEIYLG